jgi:hypothetical protein
MVMAVSSMDIEAPLAFFWYVLTAVLTPVSPFVFSLPSTPHGIRQVGDEKNLHGRSLKTSQHILTCPYAHRDKGTAPHFFSFLHNSIPHSR